jgi:glycosyltransferase involved in cell wall biosynthesis
VRVLVDTSFAARGRSGTAVYVEELVRALRARPDLEVIEPPGRRRLRPGRAGKMRNPLRSAVNALLDLAWERRGLARAARTAGADVLHHPLPARSPRAGCAQVVTVHDVAFERLPHEFDQAWRTLARRGHRAAVRAADAIVCPSQATAEDAVELLGAERERIVVAPHGPGQAMVAASGERGAGHFLYVGSDEPRKAVGRLVTAYEAYRRDAERPLELVLAGEAARQAGGPGVRGEPDPDAGRLAELLGGAAALVHPAPLEGFGLTLLEAMIAGVPVLAVHSRSAEEVCGDAALLVEPPELTGALARMASDGPLRERLTDAGRERAEAFSWAASAEGHERAYRLAMSRHGGTA